MRVIDLLAGAGGFSEGEKIAQIERNNGKKNNKNNYSAFGDFGVHKKLLRVREKNL